MRRIYDNLTEDDLKAARAEYGLRRADRFTSLALAAIRQALDGQELPSDCALVTASSFGPHRTVFANLDDILDYPEDQILPTKFSHSVHNAAASYICTALHIRGPVFAVTGFDDIESQALSLGECLIAASMAPNALIVEMEEAGILTEAAPVLLPERFKEPVREIVKVFLI